MLTIREATRFGSRILPSFLLLTCIVLPPAMAQVVQQEGKLVGTGSAGTTILQDSSVAVSAATAQSHGIGTLARGVPAAGITAAGWGIDAARTVSAGSQALNNAGDATEADAVWKKAGADEGLRQAFERAAYSLEESGHGTYRGVNPAQRLTLEFNGREARLSHPYGSVAFHLTGYGYGDRLQKPARAQLTATGNRVEYQRPDLTEWYVNRSQGLEQGFTLAHRPAADHETGPLVMALGVNGGLALVQRADEGSVLFESSQGVVLRYAGLRAWDARGRVLPSRLEVRGREIRLIVEDESAEYPLVIDPVWTQQQELTASDGAASDWFGNSVSVSGDTAVIGAYRKNGSQGAAYVFVRSNGVWSQQQELTASDGAASDQFGISVSVSGDTAAIGASTKTINSNAQQGAAYVFVRSGGVWGQQQKLTASDGAASDQFGISVSVSGDTAAIGASTKIINSNAQQGAAYVFARIGGVWSQQPELTASNGGANDYLGASVAVSGETTVIGAYGKNSYQGAAYVFVRPMLGANALLVSSAAGASSVVLAYSGAWTATANDGFLHISAGSASGASNAVVVFTYDAFSGTGTRTGTLTIAGLTVTVTQVGTNYIGASPVITLVSSGLNFPSGVAVDGSGNVYIADTNNNAIKEWNPATQQVTTLVSSGLSSPSGVAVDGSSNVYMADYGNNAIKEWSAATHLVTTLVSSGLFSPQRVAVDGSGNVYIAEIGAGNIAIKEWNPSTQQLTTLVSSGLLLPSGVAVDGSGNVYIVDAELDAIEEWSASTHLVTTLVSSGLVNPGAVAVDGSGNVYFANAGNNPIKEWSAATQQVTTLVSSGLVSPQGVAVDGSGNVYIADSNNNAIKMIPRVFVGPASLTEPAAAGSDSMLPVLPSTTSLAGIFAPTSDQGWLTIGTIANGVVSFSYTANTSTSPRTAHITVLGQQITVAQSGVPVAPVLSVTKAHAGNFTQGQNGAAYTVTVSNGGSAGSSGTVTVTETLPSGLSLVSMAGTGWTCAANTCTRSDSLAADASYPAIAVTVNVAGTAPSQVTNVVGVSGGGSANDSASDVTTIVAQYNTQYIITTLVGDGTNTTLNGPKGVAVDTAGNIYVAEQGSGLIKEVSPSGVVTVVAGGGPGGQFEPIATNMAATGAQLSNPDAVAVDSSGNYYVGGLGGNVLFRVTGGIVHVVDCPQADGLGSACPAAGQITGVVADNAGNVYYSSLGSPDPALYSRAVYAYKAGVLTLVAGNGTVGCTGGEIGLPRGLALDGAGNLYIADSDCAVVWKVTPSGTITIAAGTAGIPGFSGDGGPATNATLNQPNGVAVDATGNLYITDNANCLIRQVNTAGIIHTIAGNGQCGYSGDGGPATNAALELGPSSGIAAGPGGKIYFSDSANYRVRQLTPATALGITKTHTGNFAPGQQGATYTVTVSNPAGAGPTNGTVTVTEILPSGLTLVSMAGQGWTCGGTSCSRNDALAGGSSYPAITVTVNVAGNATSPQVNAVSVSGGGSLGANTTDTTTIVINQPPQAVSVSPE